MNRQKTIKNPSTVQGRGLFGGEPCRLRFVPAPPNTGVWFIRNDTPKEVRIRADISSVAKRPRRTTVANGSVTVETVEHVLSAVSGLGLDNLYIEVSAPETPSTDGSAQSFVEALLESGIVEQDAPRDVFIITESVQVSEGDAMIAALPGPTDCLDILYDLDYANAPAIGHQVLGFRLDKDDYAKQIAPARTFLLEKEAQEFRARGMGKHLSHTDILVMGPKGPVGNKLRFPDEHVRHKVVDLIGDLSLMGKRLRGRIVAYKSGHELNQALVRKLIEVAAAAGKPPRPAGDSAAAQHMAATAAATPIKSPVPAANGSGEAVMDIRKIMHLLPHRYPFLMIDRVIEMDGDRKAVAIKNVSINEPFFQGHFPGLPIMPGVMILEALAQLSGILLSQRLEHSGKVAMLLSMDRVKIRRPVRPGDQLILQAESLHVRSRTGHCRCTAYIGMEVAAEAEIKFMLVDAEPL